MAISANSLVKAGVREVKTQEESFTSQLHGSVCRSILDTSFQQNDEQKQRFIANVMAITTNNDALRSLGAISVVNACLQANALHLSCNSSLGEAYVIPYGDKVQFQVGVNGLIQLALRTGKYARLNTVSVKEGELAELDNYGEPIFRFNTDFAARQSLKTVGYMAAFSTKDGFSKTIFMSKEAIIRHATFYSGFSKEKFAKYEEIVKSKGDELTHDDVKTFKPWYTEFDRMAEKTVLKALLKKWGPKNTELQTALDIQDERADDPEPKPKKTIIEIDDFDMGSSNQSTPEISQNTIEATAGTVVNVIEEKQPDKKAVQAETVKTRRTVPSQQQKIFE